MGGTLAEREQAVVTCLPKLGPKGEQERLPRVDLTRLLQQLRVGVRYACLFAMPLDAESSGEPRFCQSQLDRPRDSNITDPLPPENKPQVRRAAKPVVPHGQEQDHKAGVPPYPPRR